jgi:hypothetical protein
MNSLRVSRHPFALCAIIVMLLGCGGSQPPIGAPGAMPQVSAIATRALRSTSWMLPQNKSGPFLYVGALKIRMYALGSSKPLHVAQMNPSTVLQAAIALDLHGHLCVANGEISWGQLFEYNASTLKFVKGLAGVGGFPALVADHLGYLYASTGGGDIVVYAPGCTHQVDAIHRGVDVVGPLVFDHSGNLYAGMQPHYAVSVYAPTTRPGHMKFVRQIRDGLNNPIELAIGPSDDLFVASYSKDGGGFITVYHRSGSKPVLRITKGIQVPEALAVDSKGRLYVAVPDYAVRSGGWISVYAPGGSQPVRKVRIPNPSALALDPSDNLYVANQARHNSVLVYSAGATKLLQTIREGNDQPSALLIGSP